ncbi:unnamed protein product [Leptosia nina]|uniref:Uncharacterized protein n=1 Tax=Leptosia nina TaxID=320188 RepID=A0AAV1JG09_9NEOP
MDNAAGGGPRGPAGRHRLRYGSLALGAFLTMHCRVTASALTGGFFLFILFLVTATAGLANPLRHFEVYLGQWSISGPGRAFRILPILDESVLIPPSNFVNRLWSTNQNFRKIALLLGPYCQVLVLLPPRRLLVVHLVEPFVPIGIGIAICINTLVRAINCCTIAAISAIYVVYSVSDSQLPFTYCRDFELKPYDPILKDISSFTLRESRFLLATGDLNDDYYEKSNEEHTSASDYDWRNLSLFRYRYPKDIVRKETYQIQMCKEEYPSGYPTLFSTPAYNFFYVEVVSFRSEYSFGQFNLPLVLSIVVVWTLLWLLLVCERISHGRLIWNNMYTWLLAVPWIWSLLLLVTAFVHLASMPKSLRIYRIGVKEIIAGIADALEIALYIHSASAGTELIHGKGLNHYASGHIDPHLNGENVWHSGLLLLLTGLNSGGAAVCALVDYIQPNTKAVYNMYES